VPARGRRTVISFGLPHFGYVTFYELKGIVWRFLTEAATGKVDYIPRLIHDPFLDCEIRRVRILLAKNREDAAERVLDGLLNSDVYKLAIDPWLQLAVVGYYRKDDDQIKRAFDKATEIAKDNPSVQAELEYCKGCICRLNEEFKKAKKHLEKANTYKPGVGRFLERLGYVNWWLKDRKAAIKNTKKALEDTSIPDPFVTGATSI
jgi:tetratricopeptide (TPR) repeat protein